MHYTMEWLKDGNTEVMEYYRLAFGKWRKVFEDIQTVSVDELARRIHLEQIGHFETHCGGRFEGQEVMAWSAIAYFYTIESGFDGNEANVKKLIEAWKESGVSIEVHHHFREAIRAYDAENL